MSGFVTISAREGRQVDSADVDLWCYDTNVEAKWIDQNPGEVHVCCSALPSWKATFESHDPRRCVVFVGVKPTDAQRDTLDGVRLIRVELRS